MRNESVKQQATANLLQKCSTKEIEFYLQISFTTLICSQHWAELDDDGNFKETFIKTHGENSWQVFLENMNDTFSNGWDEIWTYNPTLSGHK